MTHRVSASPFSLLPASAFNTVAVQLGIQGDEHLAQPAPRMRPQHAEPLVVAGGRADRQSRRAVGGSFAVKLMA